MELSQMDIDAIKEVANIGTGQASVALSMLFNQRVEIGLPDTSIINLDDLGKHINSSETMVGIYSNIKDGLLGNILMIVPLSCALSLVNRLNNNSNTKLEEDDIKALGRIGSVLNSCYLTGVAQLLGQRIVFHQPNVVSLFGNSIVDFLSVRMNEGEKLLLVNIDFTVKEYGVNGGFMLLLTMDSLYPLVQRLKQKLSVGE